MADLRVSTPAPAPVLPVRMPDPVTVDFLKSTPLAKPLPTPNSGRRDRAPLGRR